MPRSPRRARSGKASGRASGRRATDAFGRIFELLGRAADGKPDPREVRARFSDLVRLAGRVRQLEKRLGRKGAAELSPYLQSLLRLVTEPRVVAPALLKKAASF
ncbi:MAG: hypothetical protein ACYTKD_30095 [Planctomycetota bacterium]|jgi:hypothetical protein